MPPKRTALDGCCGLGQVCLVVLLCATSHRARTSSGNSKQPARERRADRVEASSRPACDAFAPLPGPARKRGCGKPLIDDLKPDDTQRGEGRLSGEVMQVPESFPSDQERRHSSGVTATSAVSLTGVRHWNRFHATESDAHPAFSFCRSPFTPICSTDRAANETGDWTWRRCRRTTSSASISPSRSAGVTRNRRSTISSKSGRRLKRGAAHGGTRYGHRSLRGAWEEGKRCAARRERDRRQGRDEAADEANNIRRRAADKAPAARKRAQLEAEDLPGRARKEAEAARESLRVRIWLAFPRLILMIGGARFFGASGAAYTSFVMSSLGATILVVHRRFLAFGSVQSDAHHLPDQQVNVVTRPS
jgi:hypothetical protein